MDIPKINGKHWLAKGLLYVLTIVALIAFIVVKEMTLGSPKTNERIARIEEIIDTMRSLPSDVSGMKVSMESVKVTVDKIEKKLDAHLDK